MGLLPLFFIYFSLLFLSSEGISNRIGINYGILGNNLPSPYQSIEFIKSMKASRVKIYDANPEILTLLSRTNISVSIMVPNHEIITVASNQMAADQWIQNNVLPFYPSTIIQFILVGNEILSYVSEQDRLIWQHLVPAMHRIQASLDNKNINSIKVGTPLAMDVFQTTFPPSSGMFRPAVSGSVIEPLLRFLNRTRSFFFIDVYPYFPWSADPTTMSLDFALFTSNISYTDPVSNLVYTNLLDQMLDSVYFAMAKLGFPDIRLVISETGWPHAGDVDQIGANIYNAATYNRNLIRKITSRQGLGTPARPDSVIPTYLFSLYDENRKTGTGIERHWGLLHANGTSVYEIDLTGRRPLSEYKPLPVANNNVPYRGEVWCVAARWADLMELNEAMNYVCNQGDGMCDKLAAGKECYEPASVFRHASYAFSSYWAKFRSQGATCNFNGLAEQITVNPSGGDCVFPSVTF